MAIALSGSPVLSNSGGTTATSMNATLASTTVGDLNIIAVSANTTGAAGDPAQSVTGWTAVPGGSSGKTGSPWHRLSLFYRFYQSGDGTTAAVTIAALGNIECAAVAYSGVNSTTPFVSGEVLAQQQPSSSTSWSTGSITTAALRWIISVFGNRTNGTWSALTDTQRLTGIVASSANIAFEDSNGTVAAGTITARTATFSAATSVGNTVIVALNPAGGSSFSGTAALTSGSTLGGAVTASLTTAGGMTSGSALAGQPGTTGSAALTSASTLTGSATATVTDGGGLTSGSALTGAVAAIRGAAGGMTSGSTLTGSAQAPIVTQLLTGGVQWPAHRDGTYATNGEETLEGYAAAAAQYSKAILEISVWDTSDGVYVCSHDQTTGRVFSGANLTITSTAWATLSPNGASTVGRPTTLVGGNPMRRLEEILDAFPTRLFIVENKHGTNQATLSTLLDSHAAGRWMFKGPYNDTANAVIAAGHGAPMWLYFYPSQLGSLSTSYSAVSSTGVPIVFGLGDYSAAPVPVQSDATTFFTFTAANGIKTWAHILGTSAQKTTADGQASTAGASFNGYMTSSFPTIAPNDSTSAAMTSGSTLTGAAALSVPESAGLTSGSGLTGAVQKSTAGSSGMTSGSALTGQPAAVLQAAGAMTSGSALTGSLSASLIGTAGMASASALAGAVSATDQAAAGMASASALTGAGTTGVAGSMQSASTLAGTATAALTAATGMVSGSSLAGNPTRTAQSAGGMTSGSTLAASASSTGNGSTGMTSLSSFAAVTVAQLSAMASMQSASLLTGSATIAAAGPALIYSVFTGRDRWHVTTGSSRWTVTTGAVE